jgi:hypothetical protein
MTVGAGVQWAPKKVAGGVLVDRAVLDVGLPTGKYSDLRPVNIGNHFVVVDPYYAVTYERKKTEFSIRLHYLWNSTNNDPFVGFGIRSMQPGQAFHVNYATSYELWKNKTCSRHVIVDEVKWLIGRARRTGAKIDYVRSKRW